jgi:hypothetical protein
MGITWEEMGLGARKECNATHFDLQGTYTLGRQDELNKTFTYIQQKITDVG